MNKVLRILSSLAVGIGLILLFVYCGFRRNADTIQMLNQPSYYTLQNYWYLLLSGCGCIALSIVSCFLSWHRDMDTKVEILPNAAGAEKAELLGWLTGSSLDTRKTKREIPAAAPVIPLGEDEEDTFVPGRGKGEKTQSTLFGRNRHAVPDPEETELTEDSTVLEDDLTETDAQSTVIQPRGRRM